MARSLSHFEDEQRRGREPPSLDAFLEDPEIMGRFRAISELDAELHAWVSRDLYPALRSQAGNPPSDPRPTLPGRRPTLKYAASRFWQRSACRYALKIARALG